MQKQTKAHTQRVSNAWSHQNWKNTLENIQICRNTRSKHYDMQKRVRTQPKDVKIHANTHPNKQKRMLTYTRTNRHT